MYGLGEYTPDYLSTENGSALINETFRVLNEGVNLGLSEQVDEAFKAKLEDSVLNFSGFKTNKELEEVNSLLRDENGNLRPFDQFKQDVLKLNDKYNLNYLQAEYNMAVQSAQMASKWQDFEAHKDFVNLQYRTAGDEKVRAEHAALDGTTLPVEDPFWSEYLPPLGWNCRCTVVEVLKDKHPESNSDEAIKAGAAATSQPSQKIFRFNPGKTGEVFPPKHPYYKVGKGVGVIVNEALTNKRVNDMVKKESNPYLTPEEKKAIAQNNVEIEDKLGIKKGAPMSIEEADRQKANPKYNPKDSNNGYSENCAYCTVVYMLRKRGFEVTARKVLHSRVKPIGIIRYMSEWPDKWRTKENQAPNVTKITEWMKSSNVKELTPQKFKEFISTVCDHNGTYELGIPIKSSGNHYTIIEKTDNGIQWVDPQVDIKNLDFEFLCNNILNITPTKANSFYGVIRIDNLNVNTDYLDIIEK